MSDRLIWDLIAAFAIGFGAGGMFVWVYFRLAGLIRSRREWYAWRESIGVSVSEEEWKKADEEENL
jgi:hypothetical protein